MRREVVVVPVSDVDRAKQSYVEGCGFGVDLDGTLVPGMKFGRDPDGNAWVLQETPDR